MVSFILGTAVGLVVGWWFIPQPQWAKDVYAKLSGKSNTSTN